MTPFAERFTAIVEEAISAIVHEASVEKIEEIPDAEYIFTDTVGEIIDRLLILHIRVWHLENRAQAVIDDDAAYANVRRKIEYCFKVKRPGLMAALNRALGDVIKRGREELLLGCDVKQYEGIADAVLR